MGALLVVVYTYREPDTIRLILAWKAHKPRRKLYEKNSAEPCRDMAFTGARRGAVIPTEAGKTKLSIRIDNTVIAYFRAQVEQAGPGNCQTLISDALVAHTQQRAMVDVLRQLVREELSASMPRPRAGKAKAVTA